MSEVVIIPTRKSFRTGLSRIYTVVYETHDTIWDFLENGLQPYLVDLTGTTSMCRITSYGWFDVDPLLYGWTRNASGDDLRTQLALQNICSWPFGRPSLALARLVKRVNDWDWPAAVFTEKVVKSVCRQVLGQSKKVSDSVPLCDQIIYCYLKIKSRMKRFGLDYRKISGLCLVKDLYLCQLLSAEALLQKASLRCQNRWTKQFVFMRRRMEKEEEEKAKKEIELALSGRLNLDELLKDLNFRQCWLDTTWGADWPPLPNTK
ncbi:nonstructural protein [Toyo virus]|uniref:Nonstructural protein n=1 Tax=Toyo virus TaxID=2874031 RepID=A0ABM7PQ39_9VIRU|nr:nonstructural protein [Toyo virus]BCT55143.1 nonstructural protein [Toyo virus]